jgi:serine protease Do
MSEPTDTTAPGADADPQIEQLGVFQVFTGGGTGTGFLIDKRLLLTNCHVVAPYRKVAIELRDRRRILGTVRLIHPRRDLAIVEVDHDLPEAVFEVVSSEGLKSKQRVSIIGFPVGLPLSLTEGVISHPHQLLDEQHFVQTDAAINPGNSGGPIIDEQRNVVAVTTCKLRAADMVGFGIPGTDVRTFIAAYRAHAGEFAVLCPSCEARLLSAARYCDGCGTDLEELELGTYFEDQDDHPVAAFVERGLAQAKIDPVLARHGELNWSFYSGSAPIQIWSCCSEHLCLSSGLAQPGKTALGELFRHLLDASHRPYAFDLDDDNIIRFNLTLHASDVFSDHDVDALVARIATFIARADELDNELIEKYGCAPAPRTQLTFLKEGSR